MSELNLLVVKHCDHFFTEKSGVHARFNKGFDRQIETNLLETIEHKRLCPIGVMYIPRAMMKVKDLAALSHRTI